MCWLNVQEEECLRIKLVTRFVCEKREKRKEKRKKEQKQQRELFSLKSKD
jgi:hypothetical protein